MKLIYLKNKYSQASQNRCYVNITRGILYYASLLLPIIDRYIYIISYMLMFVFIMFMTMYYLLLLFIVYSSKIID